MAQAKAPAVFLLIQNSEEGAIAVKFPSSETARTWEDEHEYDVCVVGCVRLVSKSEALRIAKANTTDNGREGTF